MYLDRRIKPVFLIIGGVKCASSSLYRYLVNHPNVLPSTKKEIGFFSNRSLIKTLLKLPFYLQYFPKRRSNDNAQMSWYELDQSGEVTTQLFEKPRELNTEYITGEATATYNFDANPKTVKWIFPKMRIIALVRNPTDRYISHHKMFARFHQEGRTGYDVGDLLSFVKKEITAHNQGKPTRILHQGLYHHHLSKWVHNFGKKRVFLAKSEQLMNAKSAVEVLNDLVRFLGLPAFDFRNAVTEKFNVAPHETHQNEQAIALLNDFYAPHNQLMLTHFGIDLGE